MPSVEQGKEPKGLQQDLKLLICLLKSIDLVNCWAFVLLSCECKFEARGELLRTVERWEAVTGILPLFLIHPAGVLLSRI